MKVRRLLTALCTVMVLVGFIGCDKVLALSLNVEQGEKYNINMVNDQDVVVTVNDKDVKTHQLMDINLGMDVKNVDKDKNIATLCYTYDSIKASTESAGETINYDSRVSGTNNPLSDVYSAIVNKSFTVKVDNKGKVLDVRGIENIINSVVDNVPVDAEKRKALKASLAQSFSDDAIKAMVGQSMNYFPPQDVKVGDVWETTGDVKAGFPMKIINKWNLLSESDDLLHVGVQSTIVANTKNEAMDIMGVKAIVKLNGVCNGTVDINKDNGLIQEGTFAQDIAGEMTVTNPSAAQSITMPMKITEHITYETTKK